MAEKSDTSSLEKIEHHEIDTDKDANAARVEELAAGRDPVKGKPTRDIDITNDRAEVVNEARKSKATPNSQKTNRQTLSPLRPIKVLNSLSQNSTVRIRSSSVGGRHESSPQHKGTQRLKPNEQEAHAQQIPRPGKPLELDNKAKGALAISRVSKATELHRQRKEKSQRKEAAHKDAQEREENERLAEQGAYQKELQKEAREEERSRRAENREEEKIREDKRQYEAQRREETRQAINQAPNAKALSLADLDKLKAQNQFVERFNGMADEQQKFSFDPTSPRGPSQTVIYTSRFVDRLSDVTDDMSVSGSLSIKAAKVGNSGRGSFVDSDKFKESDLNSTSLLR